MIAAKRKVLEAFSSNEETVDDDADDEDEDDDENEEFQRAVYMSIPKAKHDLLEKWIITEKDVDRIIAQFEQTSAEIDKAHEESEAHILEYEMDQFDEKLGIKRLEFPKPKGKASL